MRLFYCTHCKVPIPQNIRQQRPQGKGWKCPICGTGLPTKPMNIIEEEEAPHEILLRALQG